MPNGKGTLDCSYCQHYQSQHGSPHEEGSCTFHNAVLPQCDDNRICCHFQANSQYFLDNSTFTPPARRFAWFGKDLWPGVVYHFMYNTPPEVDELIVVQKPDHENETWLPAD